MPNEPMSEDATEAIAALERFVVDSDELLELEERIGRFNIFDALGIVNVEIRHSNFLAWILDPNESHNQGGLFLRAFLMDLLRQSAPDQRPTGLSPITLDGGELRGVEIRREWQNIDLLLYCEHPQFVIAIENKIGSSEHSNQLQRYKDMVCEHFGDAPRQFVFLTPEGDEPSDEDWTIYDYGSLHNVLRRVVDANRSAIGEDVLAFLEHYLRILRSRLMDDPKIDDLCRRIYQNHRQAIDLIAQRAKGAERREARDVVRRVVREHDRLVEVSSNATEVSVAPDDWLELLPPIGTVASRSAHLWIVGGLAVHENDLSWYFYVCPCSDTDLRGQYADMSKQTLAEVDHFRPTRRRTDQWTKLGGLRCYKWEPGRFDVEAAERAVSAALDRIVAGFDALRPKLEAMAAKQ